MFKSKLRTIAILLLTVLLLGLGAVGGWKANEHYSARGCSEITTLFTPYDKGLQSYLEFLDRAKKSVHVAAYSFNEESIANKLIELKTQRGVEVRVLLDLSQVRAGTGDDILVERMKAAGIEVVVGTSERSHQIMHHKFTVVDGIYIEDGSWNYTRRADLQANVLNFDYCHPERAARFLSTWHKMHAFMQAQERRREQRAQ